MNRKKHLAFARKQNQKYWSILQLAEITVENFIAFVTIKLLYYRLISVEAFWHLNTFPIGIQFRQWKTSTFQKT